MIENIKAFIIKQRETIAYLFIGGTTVLLNIFLYWVLLFILDDIPANTVAFFITVMYAYFANCLFVFRNKLTWTSFWQFWGMRIGTLLIDNGGLWLLLFAGCNRIIAKTLVNIVIIVLNYILSKFIIFKGKI